MAIKKNTTQKDREIKKTQDEPIVIRRIASGAIDSEHYLRKSSRLRSAFFITMTRRLLKNLKIHSDNQ